MRGRKGGAKKQPRNMTVVWCLLGLLVGGLLLALFQTGGEQEKKPRRPQIRRTVKEEVKPAPVVVPEEVVQPADENPSPESPEKSESVPEEIPNVPSESAAPESAAPEELPNVPDASSPGAPDSGADEGDDDDSEDTRESRLDATAPNGEYYIDMETRSLLFTDDASLNDENLEIYLEETYAETESERYDEEAAERTDENKQVK